MFFDMPTPFRWRMLEIFLILLPLLAMAKRGKGRGRRRFTLRRVRIANTVAPGALAAGAVITGVGSNATTNSMRFISLDASYSWTDIQQITDDGMEFGVAHSDYTSAEVEAALEAGASMDIGNLVSSREVGQRLVRVIGVMPAMASAAGAGVAFNDGRRVKTRLNWPAAIGDTLNFWMRNASGVIWVTGSNLNVIGDLWVKDSL